MTPTPVSVWATEAPQLTVARPLEANPVARVWDEPSVTEGLIERLTLRASFVHPLERITAYNPVPEQTDEDPSMSSCGPTKARQIAISRDLLFDGGRKVLCGEVATIVYEHRGETHLVTGVINDTLNARYTNTADILMADYHDALAFGVKTGLLIVH